MLIPLWAEQVIFSIMCECASKSAPFESFSANCLPLMCQMDNGMVRLISEKGFYDVGRSWQSKANNWTDRFDVTFLDEVMSLFFGKLCSQADIRPQHFFLLKKHNLFLTSRLTEANPKQSNTHGSDGKLSDQEKRGEVES